MWELVLNEFSIIYCIYKHKKHTSFVKLMHLSLRSKSKIINRQFKIKIIYQ